MIASGMQQQLSGEDLSNSQQSLAMTKENEMA
jgi:hypothetical protein